jgi:magnesium chelatase family protein
MLAKVMSCAMVGLEGAIVEVEVDIPHGLPAFTKRGYPRFSDAIKKESFQRIWLTLLRKTIQYKLEQPNLLRLGIHERIGGTLWKLMILGN